MDELINNLKTLLADPMVGTVLRVAFWLCVFFPLVIILARILRKTLGRRYSSQTGMVAGKAVGYLGFIVVAFAVLNEFGFHLGTLLGAAGIMAVAIGFAAQTSLSNIISGLFLIVEKPLAVGDLVRIDGDTGTVMSVDLLSIKIRAMDNRFIRIPNENIIKSNLVNITRFPLRRIDLKVGVAYREDARRVMEVLRDIARREPLCLEEPEPLVLFENFGDSALEFLFGVWCIKKDYWVLRNNITLAIKERFDAEDIEIPFPHRSIYAGSVTDPMPIRIVPGGDPVVPEKKESVHDE